MFVLRSIEPGTPAFNVEIGNDYEVIYKSSYADRFAKVWKNSYGESKDMHGDCFALLLSTHNERHIVKQLRATSDHYIMTEGGKTFEKIVAY